MSDLSKRGLNPNAAAFVPNVQAAPFVPGQATHSISNPPPDANINAPNGDVSHNNAQPTQSAEPAESWEADVPDTIASAATASVNPPQPVSVVTPVSIDSSDVSNGQPSAAEKESSCAAKAAEEQEDDEDVEETPRPSPPPRITSSQDRREHVNVVFIGHVDAGKSTIGGHIMYLTGMVDRRTLEKYEREAKEKNRESWYLSWALDTNMEEREKGKTVEVGRAYFETDKKHFTILDAPGHKSFVPNMIGGASQADLAVLVISARRGEFETGFERGGQTQEHAMLVKTAGVKRLIILVNKMDDSTVEWDEERFNEIKERLTPYLKKTGFNVKTDLIFIPCSGLTGAFLKDPPDEPKASWYTGPCFIEYLDSLPQISRAREGPVRMVVVDKFNDMGTIVIGKVESGVIAKGQTLTLMPNKDSIQVLQLWTDDVETEDVGPGENIKAKVKGVEEDDIMPGFTVCSTDSLCRVGRIFDAQVKIVECRSIIAPGYSAVLHIHAAVEEVKVQALLALVDPKTNKPVSGQRPRFVKQNQLCFMRLESQELFCLERFKDFDHMGRFTLRDEGKTIAFGKVMKVLDTV